VKAQREELRVEAHARFETPVVFGKWPLPQLPHVELPQHPVQPHLASGSLLQVPSLRASPRGKKMQTLPQIVRG